MLDEKSSVMCLLPAGADPHHFQMHPRTVERLAKSELLIRSSNDDGGWPLPPNHSNVLDLWPEKDHGWVSPNEVRTILPRIAESLMTLNPQRANAIQANLAQAIEITFSIEEMWRQTLATAKTSGVIMQHPSWRRLMHDMEIPILNILETGHHGHEHGPHALDDALQMLKKHHEIWLISDVGHNNRALEWLKQHSNQPLPHITLNALGACENRWDEMMLQNIKKASEATH